ncbi:hypothetical protein NHX12_030615, partial [Muraenolepis orangiensis]
RSFFQRLTGDNKSEKFFKVFYERMKLAQQEIKATVTVNTSDLGSKKKEEEPPDKDTAARKKAKEAPPATTTTTVVVVAVSEDVKEQLGQEEGEMSVIITIMQPILRLMQLLCENHNRELQFLDCICGSTTGGLGLLGLYINEKNVGLINQTVESLTEYCQGPCHENQNCIATHECNGIDIIIALILNDINPLGKKRMDLVLELKNNASKLLLAIMESRHDSENVELARHNKELQAMLKPGGTYGEGDEALEFYAKHTAQIEIVRLDRTMEQIVFPVPNICEFLTHESKLRVYYTTERDEQGSKINDFFLRSEDLFNEMNWQKKLRGTQEVAGDDNTGVPPTQHSSLRSLSGQLSESQQVGGGVGEIPWEEWETWEEWGRSLGRRSGGDPLGGGVGEIPWEEDNTSSSPSPLWARCLAAEAAGDQRGCTLWSPPQPILYWCSRNMSFWSSISFNLAVLMNLLVAFFYPLEGIRRGLHMSHPPSPSSSSGLHMSHSPSLLVLLRPSHAFTCLTLCPSSSSSGTLEPHLSALLWVAMLVSLAIVIILPQPHGIRALIASTILRLIFSVCNKVIFLMSFVGNRGTFTRGYKAMIMDVEFLYHLLYLIICSLGVFLFDLVYREETLLNVIKSVTRNGRSIVLTAVLALILVYLFSIVGYIFFQDDFILAVDRIPNKTLEHGASMVGELFSGGGACQKEGGENCSAEASADAVVVATQPSALVIEDKERVCDSLIMCIVTVLSHGLRSGGGVGDVLRKPSKEEPLSEKQKKEEVLKTTCFICGLERDKFDNKTVTFEEHIKVEHNMWHYLFFIVLVKVKDSTEYTGPESYVAEMIRDHNLDWFPRMRAMSLVSSDADGEQNEIRNLQEKLESTMKLVTNLSGQLTELKEQMTEQRKQKQRIGLLGHPQQHMNANPQQPA